MRVLLGALVACTIAMPAVAQQPTSRTPSIQTTAVPASEQWRASKMIGVNVYNEQNEKLGEINELIINQSGQVAGAIVSAGGFLGMGEHNILVPLDHLKFSNEAGKSTTGAARADNKQWYPDRAVMNATKNQVKAMPQFKY